MARKAIVIGLLWVLALALGLLVRGVGFDRSSLIQCALVGLLFGGVLGFGGLIITGIVSQKTGLSENDRYFTVPGCSCLARHSIRHQTAEPNRSMVQSGGEHE